MIVAERTPSSMSAISPKWSPGPRLAALGAAHRDGRLAGLDQEERRAVGALLHHGLAGGEVPLLEQQRDLRAARRRRGRRTAARAAAPRSARPPSAAAHPRHRAALQQVELCRRRPPIRCRGPGRRPRSQRRASSVQLREPRVVEAELLDELGRDLLLDGPAVRRGRGSRSASARGAARAPGRRGRRGSCPG